MERMFDDCKGIAKGKKAFKRLLRKELEPFIESAKEQNNFQWMHLKKLYNTCKNELTTLCNLRIFCDFAFDLFYQFSCEDDELMIKIVRLHEQVAEEYTKLDLCGFCVTFNRLPKHFLDEDVINTRKVLKRVNSIKSDDCKFTDCDYYAQLTSDATFEGYAFQRFSVKYGLNYPEVTLVPFLQLKCQLETLFGNYVRMKPGVGTDTLDNREEFANSILERVLGTSVFDELESSQTSTLVRNNLIMFSVGFAMSRYERGVNYSMASKSYKLFISTWPEPAISMKDVKDFLDIAFENDEAFKEDIIFRFKEIFKEIPSLPTPRSLKYLCRCKVRSCLKKVPSLTAVLSKIEMPSTVKDYLLYMSD